MESEVEVIDASAFPRYVRSGKRPFVIRGQELCDRDDMLRGAETSQSVKLGIYDKFSVNTSTVCANLTTTLQNSGCGFVNNRYWHHDKGHVTRWHFDGDGVQVINICLRGSKRFLLAPPGMR